MEIIHHENYTSVNIFIGILRFCFKNATYLETFTVVDGGKNTAQL